MGEAHHPDKDASADQDDRELERRIREHRKFDLAEAIGRLGGGDLMKGASPITRRRQASLVIEDYLEKHLRDAEGALEIVLHRRVVASQTLLEIGYDEPLVALGRYCQQLLESEGRLHDFVRAVDSEWGRIYQERPKFNLPQRPAQPDDPYTPASVTEQLQALLARLSA